jgi:hypothetical protein
MAEAQGPTPGALHVTIAALFLSLSVSVLEKRMPGAWTPSIDFYMVKACKQQQKSTCWLQNWKRDAFCPTVLWTSTAKYCVLSVPHGQPQAHRQVHVLKALKLYAREFVTSMIHVSVERHKNLNKFRIQKIFKAMFLQ